MRFNYPQKKGEAENEKLRKEYGELHINRFMSKRGICELVVMFPPNFIRTMICFAP